MAKATRKTEKAPPRRGDAVWLIRRDAELLRAIAAAEDRAQTTVMRRALEAYAQSSRDYQATVRGGSP